MSKKEVTIKQEVPTMQTALLEIVRREDIDPDRLEKFLDLQVKMEERQAKKDYNSAMSLFQKECPIITQNKKGHNNTYATYDQIIFKVRPIMARHGFSFAFTTEPLTGITEKSNLIITVMHEDGHSEKFEHQYFNLDEGGKMNNSQRTKSALTYAKRALMENAFGIATQGADDDAARAVDEPATTTEIEKIKTMMINLDVEDTRILKYLNINSLETMTKQDVKKVNHALNQMRTKGINESNL